MTNSKYYFAYGSNLNVEQMKFRCPKAKLIKTAHLPDWRLVFRGVADVEPFEGLSVPGALWAVTEECEKSLDQYEGCRPDGNGLYRREFIDVVTESPNGAPIKETALVYIMNRDGYDAPGEIYARSIIDGYKHNNLDPQPLYQAISYAFDNSPSLAEI